MLNLKYDASVDYSVGAPRIEGRGVHEIRRPKSLYEVNKGKKTPYTEAVCGGASGCGKRLGFHHYLNFAFVDDPRRGKLFCRLDATLYFTVMQY